MRIKLGKKIIQKWEVTTDQEFVNWLEFTYLIA